MATTATETATYFRFGRLPRESDTGIYLSGNHRDGGQEEGLSVYPGTLDGDVLTLDLRGIDSVSALFIIDQEDCWQIDGGALIEADWMDEWGFEELGRRARGADGEPLLWGGPDLSEYGLTATWPIITASRVAVRQIITITD